MLRISVARRPGCLLVVVAKAGVNLQLRSDVEAVVRVDAPKVRVPRHVAVLRPVGLLEGVRDIVRKIRKAAICKKTRGEAGERVEQVAVEQLAAGFDRMVAEHVLRG